MQKLISTAIGCFLLGCLSWAQDVAPLDPGLIADAAKTAPVTDDKSKTAPLVKSEPKAQRSKDSAHSEKTEHNFEDLLVQGKYHFSDEAVTTVEEDKVLDSLLGIRTDFKDKIEQSVGRY